MHHDPWTQNELQEISLQYWLHHWVCPTKGSNSILAPFIIEKSTIFMPIMKLFETAGKKQTEAHEAKTGFRGMNGRCREFCSSTGRLGVCQALLLCFFSKSMLWFFFFYPSNFCLNMESEIGFLSLGEHVCCIPPFTESIMEMPFCLSSPNSQAVHIGTKSKHQTGNYDKTK